jgi:hypothetical protein
MHQSGFLGRPLAGRHSRVRSLGTRFQMSSYGGLAEHAMTKLTDSFGGRLIHDYNSLCLLIFWTASFVWKTKLAEIIRRQGINDTDKKTDNADNHNDDTQTNK